LESLVFTGLFICAKRLRKLLNKAIAKPTSRRRTNKKVRASAASAKRTETQVDLARESKRDSMREACFKDKKGGERVALKSSFG